MKNKQREALERSCKYKGDFKTETLGKDDKWEDPHPPWSKRLEYAQNYNFNKCLIRKVINDMPHNGIYLCYIDKVARIYLDKHIILDPERPIINNESR